MFAINGRRRSGDGAAGPARDGHSLMRAYTGEGCAGEGCALGRTTHTSELGRTTHTTDTPRGRERVHARDESAIGASTAPIELWVGDWHMLHRSVSLMRAYTGNRSAETALLRALGSPAPCRARRGKSDTLVKCPSVFPLSVVPLPAIIAVQTRSGTRHATTVS